MTSRGVFLLFRFRLTEFLDSMALTSQREGGGEGDVYRVFFFGYWVFDSLKEKQKRERERGRESLKQKEKKITTKYESKWEKRKEEKKRKEKNKRITDQKNTNMIPPLRTTDRPIRRQRPGSLMDAVRVKHGIVFLLERKKERQTERKKGKRRRSSIWNGPSFHCVTEFFF